MIWSTTNNSVFWEYHPNTFTSAQNFTGIEQISRKSHFNFHYRASGFITLLHYFILSNDEEYIPNIFAGVFVVLITFTRTNMFVWSNAFLQSKCKWCIHIWKNEIGRLFEYKTQRTLASFQVKEVSMKQYWFLKEFSS